MSSPTSMPRIRRRSSADFVIAGLGLALAVGWYVWVKTGSDARYLERSRVNLEAAERIVKNQQALVQKRLLGAAQMLSGDQRVRQTVLDAIDEPTLVDTFKDLEQLDGLPFHAVLDARGVVGASVGLPIKRGLDLASTSLVREALAADKGASSRWFLDGHLVEIAAAAVRQGNDVKAVVVVGVPIDDTSLAAMAASARAHLAVVADGKVVASSPIPAEEATVVATLAAGGPVVGRSSSFVEVPTAMPPVKLLFVADAPADAPPPAAFFIPLIGALAFACLVVIRGAM